MMTVPGRSPLLHSRAAGFTVIEMLITVFVAAMFIVAINALYSSVIRGSSTERNRAEAGNLAYQYLRQYVYNGATPPSSFTCSTGDLTANPNASGTLLTSGSLDKTQTSIPQPVAYTVRAYAPYGCTGAAFGSPLLIRSSVTYGPAPQITLTHSAYVGY